LYRPLCSYIPTKNNADILEKCLESIKQTLEKFDQQPFRKSLTKNAPPASQLDYPNDEYEVIVVDGHSTDNTVKIAEKYGCKVVYENAGTIGAARNIGVDISNGDPFVVFI
jgi:glycosyltransferase involved in cell wall biosynthesis